MCKHSAHGLAHCECSGNVRSYITIMTKVIVIIFLAEQEAEGNCYHHTETRFEQPLCAEKILISWSLLTLPSPRHRPRGAVGILCFVSQTSALWTAYSMRPLRSALNPFDLPPFDLWNIKRKTLCDVCVMISRFPSKSKATGKIIQCFMLACCVDVRMVGSRP